ncbi:hypothetical protein [Bacillus cereus group sp. Bce040]|uniref:hypothetical protein n=1 Tax=Bacillus cereus group sp. Bce040 TaxID=3445229 RepID=UPI003F228079
MSNNEKSEKKSDVFEETFGGLIESSKEKPDAVVHQPENKLEDVLFGEEENKTLSHEEAEKAAENYIPPSIGDEQWEEFVGRVPLPPINREQESRAVSIGLQEIRKMKEYMLYIHRHMINEFNRIYASFPILFAQDFEDKFGTAHKEIITIMEDIEHLVAGDIDHVEAVKNDFKLTQVFEEKRLSLLYDLLEHYNKKK